MLHKYRTIGLGTSVSPEPTEPTSAQHEQASSDHADPHTPKMQAWEQLAYEFNGGDYSQNSTTTVEEELNQYSMSMLKKLGKSDLLSFWHVSIYWQYTVIRFTVLHRCMKVNLQCSSQWQWTTFPFKHQQSHVNMFSPPV